MIRRFRNYILTGLFVTTPIFLTVYIFWTIFNGLDNVIMGVLNQLLVFFNLHPYEGKIPGIGIIFMILVVLLAGIAAKNYFGSKLFKLGDRIVAQIPFFSSIYIAIRQIFEAFFSEKREVFKQAVLFEYPRKGTYSIGFVTQDTRGEIQEHLEDDMLSVFLPTTPNPTSGYLIFVPKTDVIRLYMPIEEALKLIISGGAITPNSKKIRKVSFEDMLPVKMQKKKRKIDKKMAKSGVDND